MKINLEKEFVKITITKETRERLIKFGFKNSTWDDIIKDLLKHCNICERFWENRSS